VLLDSISRTVNLGNQIGRGGEGIVYEVDGEPTLVAKVYHKKPLPDDQVAKLQAMVACWSSPLETIAAWPRSLLYDPISRKPCGILMTKMDVARPLHELYGTTNRRRHFPEAGWHHMVLAARNTAAAFQTLHSANILVGDVNQGNLLVDNGMCVRMIDCDSFQLTTGGRTYHCGVGTPHFTPPELQSQKLRDITRTPNHDRFGLAVLIFHLLFVGRHPFAGRYRGAGDLSIEKAIAERRFAFSNNRHETLVDPPPASLLLDDLPPGLANLFEAAFRGRADDPNSRPEPRLWVQELEALMKSRRNCSFDAIHVYYSRLDECPWCRIEDAGGPAFFVGATGTTIISADRLKVLDDRIWELEQTLYPDLPPQRLELPTAPVLRTLKEMPKSASPDWVATLMVAAWAICFSSVAVGNTNGAIVLAAGTVLSLLSAAFLIFGKKARERRQQADSNAAALQSMKDRLARQAAAIRAHHAQREEQFNRSNEDIKQQIQLYRTAADNLQSVIAQHRELQKAEYLRSFSLRDCIRKIFNLTPSQVIMLESFGVETANDIERIRLYGIPSIDPETVVELLQWRWDVEQAFVFTPEHGITIADVGAAKEMAVRKFKISQARSILTGAKQIETLAEVAESDLRRGLNQFDAACEQWKSAAKEFRDFQSGRRRFERLINQSPSHVVGAALGVPFVAAVLFFLFGWQ
jgi:DNA-binding helix-hairpin-helix protein with protein kinase domain